MMTSLDDVILPRHHVDVIADVIHRAVTETDGTPEHPVAQEIREQVTDLVTRFPAYPR